MNPKRIAFLFNIRHQYPNPLDPTSQVETDFDDPPTIEAIIKTLEKCGYSVIPIEADQHAYTKLLRFQHELDLVFNYSMGIYGLDRYAHLPAMLEMLQLPYTGSRPLTQALVLNKPTMQEVLAANKIPVPPSQIFSSPIQPLRNDLLFPLIVKPIAQGSSAGITSKSVVHSNSELQNQIHEVISVFKEPALVQPFLAGREFSLPMLGNPPEFLPIIEPDFDKIPKEYQRLDSLEVKWIFEENTEEHHLVCPPTLPENELTRIQSVAMQTWKALSIRDWCRIDIRCDSQGNPFVLDVNSPPGILPPEISTTSYFPLAARAKGLSYSDLLQTVILTAWNRIHHEKPLNHLLEKTPRP